MYLAKNLLARYSIQAVELWTQLEMAETPEQEEAIVKAIWDNQTDQETAVDTHAELADQLDAEICAIKARLKHLVTLHNQAIERLERWRSNLDKTLLYIHKIGVISTNVVGRSRHIQLKENPPSCEVLIDPSDLPSEYRTEKLVVAPNKRKIIEDWKQGIPVDGTRIERKLRVEYALVPSNLTGTTEVISNRSTSSTTQNLDSMSISKTKRKGKTFSKKNTEKSNQGIKA